MEFSLTEQQRELQQLARRFAYGEARPRARELDRKTEPRATYPADLLERAAQLGLRTLKIPAAYGGQGIDCLTRVILLQELCAGDVSVGNPLAHTWREGWTLAELTTDAQRERFLNDFLQDELYSTALAITEEHAGSGVSLPYTESPRADPRATAELRNGRWVLNGSKRWITNGNVAQLTIVVARTDALVPWTEGISLFLVPSTAKGFGVGRIEDKLGWRLNQNVEVIFEGCEIPEDYLLG